MYLHARITKVWEGKKVKRNNQINVGIVHMVIYQRIFMPELLKDDKERKLLFQMYYVFVVGF